MSNVLIVGGTSGLGLALAKRFADQGWNVYATGRTKPDASGLHFHHFDMTCTHIGELENKVDGLIEQLPRIDALVLAAGFYQEGEVQYLTAQQIFDMNCVGLLGPELIIGRLLARNGLESLVAITSTSQRTPCSFEPIYTGVKAGLAAVARSVSLGDHVKHTLVAAPAGMMTNFWKDGRSTLGLLDAGRVADRILEELSKTDLFREVKILGGEPNGRVELVTDEPCTNG